MPAVMHEADEVAVQILPGPVHARELAVVRVLLGNVNTTVIPLEFATGAVPVTGGVDTLRVRFSDGGLPGGAHLEGKVHFPIGHGIRLVSCDDDRDIHFAPVPAIFFLLCIRKVYRIPGRTAMNGKFVQFPFIV